MHDDLNLSRANAQQERPAQPGTPGSAMDREVPIVQPDSYDAMHRWLDGEATEAEARDSDASQFVEMWRGISAEATTRRQVAAPAGLTDRIMAAIPGGNAATAATTSTGPELRLAVAAPAEQSWWQTPLELTPTTALAAAGGLLVLGTILGMSIRG